MLLSAVTLAWMDLYRVLPEPPESLNQWSILEAGALLCTKTCNGSLGWTWRNTDPVFCSRMFLLAPTILRPNAIISVTATQAYCFPELLRAVVTKNAGCQCALCFGWGQPIHAYSDFQGPCCWNNPRPAGMNSHSPGAEGSHMGDPFHQMLG